MSRVARFAPVFLAVVLSSAVAGCKQQPTGASFGWKPVFGDLAKDTTPVIAQIGEVTITEADLQQFIDEQPARVKEYFVGPEGERMALAKMVEQSLMVLGAVERKLYNDQTVARSLVMQRRLMLDRAMRQYGLLRDVQPTEAQMKEFYEKNLDRYHQMETVHARDIECLTKADADRVYRQLKADRSNDNWVKVCAESSVNEKSRAAAGDLGWLNENTPVTYIDAGAAFAKVASGLPSGLNPPVEVAGRWHVVELVDREVARNSTFAEAKDQVRNELLPEMQGAIIEDYLKSARAKYGVSYQGRFTPGQGATPQQLYERAMVTTDAGRRIAVLTMIADDFPESDRADDALFLAANTLLENDGDLDLAGKLLNDLLQRYPQSDLVDDAQFMLQHLRDPSARNPKSVEDLLK